MRRLTSKDLGKRKKIEEEPPPDFYALSRENPLPEGANGTANGASQTAAPAPTAAQSSRAQLPAAAVPTGFADVELALLERRRAEILERMNSLVASKGLHAASASPAALGLGQDISQMGNFSSLMGIPNSLLNPSNDAAVLQRQMFGTRLVNSDVAKLLGLHGPGFSTGFSSGLMGNPYGL